MVGCERDSFLCRPGSASEPGFMTDGHLPCAAIGIEPVIASLFCACAREAGYGDLTFSTWKMIVLRTLPE